MVIKVMQIITSLKNPKVGEAVRLMDRRRREETGLFLIEGVRELSLAIKSGIKLLRLFYCEELFKGDDEREMIKTALKQGAELLPVTLNVFKKMVYREGSFGLLAEAEQFKIELKDISLAAPPLLIVVESAEKPGNLGAILRSADAAGADGVIVCGKGADIYNPNVVRASMGALFTIPVVESTAEEAIGWLKDKGITILAATPDADVNYFDADLSGTCAIVMGSEHEGLSNVLLKAADIKVMIPMKGKADSLNLSTATAVILYEAVRQRREKNALKI
ncbi:MAG: RNA methyltransferase [Nitrospirae bacterium]|nr:RNA methyltransferase [Nitrospirota bacterium]